MSGIFNENNENTVCSQGWIIIVEVIQLYVELDFIDCESNICINVIFFEVEIKLLLDYWRMFYK